MHDLQDCLETIDNVRTIPDLLCLARKVLIACAVDLRTDISGQKIIRQSLFRSNKALAAWESEKAFGVSRIFKPGEDEGKTP